MKQAYKKAFLIVVIFAAALMGIVLALSPSWQRHRERERQEAALGRLEQTADGIRRGETENTRATIFTDTVMEIVGEAQRTVLAETASEAEISDAPETDISEEMPDALETADITIISPTTVPRQGGEIGILTIPKIDAYLPVTAGVSTEQLRFSEGWVMQTAAIGSKGNAVIAGHRSYTYGQHFNRLGELENGDEILYTSSYGVEMRFTVSEILTVLPDDPAVFDEPPEGAAQLTLYTCTPVRKATHRLIVRALLVEDWED